MSNFSNEYNNQDQDRKKRIVKKVIVKRAATQKLPGKISDSLLFNKDGQKILKEEVSVPVENEDDDELKLKRRVPAKMQIKKSTTKKLSSETAEEVMRRKESEAKMAKAVTKKLAQETAINFLSKTHTSEGHKEKVDDIRLTAKAPVSKLTAPSAGKQEETFEIAKTRLPDNWKEVKINVHKKLSGFQRIMDILPPNTVLKGKKSSYKITEIIQKDSYGGIYKVIDLNIKEANKAIKAVKEIQYKLPKEGAPAIIRDVMSRLNRMVSFLEDASHDNLANINDYFYDISNDNVSARFFVVMEFIEGETLEKIIKNYFAQEKPVPGDLILKVIKDVCKVLHYLHNRKPFPISFGDFKPSNIIIRENDVIKLINYGLDKAFETDFEGKENYRGTLGYSAPEQTGVDFTNTKADIFAFGSTLHYLITAINPEEKPYEFFKVREIKPGISPRVEDLIIKSLNLIPEDRPNIDYIKTEFDKVTITELDTLKKPHTTAKLTEQIEEKPVEPSLIRTATTKQMEEKELEKTGEETKKMEIQKVIEEPEEKIEIKEITPEVKVEEVKEVTPEVKAEEVKEVTPEVKAEEVKEVTPEVKAEEVKEVTPEVKAEEVKEVTPEVKAETKIIPLKKEEKFSWYDNGEAKPVIEEKAEEKAEEKIEETKEKSLEKEQEKELEKEISPVEQEKEKFSWYLSDSKDEAEEVIPEVKVEEVKEEMMPEVKVEEAKELVPEVKVEEVKAEEVKEVVTEVKAEEVVTEVKAEEVVTEVKAEEVKEVVTEVKAEEVVTEVKAEEIKEVVTEVKVEEVKEVVPEVKVEEVKEVVPEVKAEEVKEVVTEVKAEEVKEVVPEVKAEEVKEVVPEVKAEEVKEVVTEVKAEEVKEVVPEVKVEEVKEVVPEVKAEEVKEVVPEVKAEEVKEVVPEVKAEEVKEMVTEVKAEEVKEVVPEVKKDVKVEAIVYEKKEKLPEPEEIQKEFIESFLIQSLDKQKFIGISSILIFLVIYIVMNLIWLITF